ncbi:MAG: DinB family protein [Fimbriimonadaceae bacterium]
MHPFAVSWELSRGRLVQEIQGLSHAQLNWRLHPKALSIAQMVVHVAGVELSFASQLTGTPVPSEDEPLRRAATEGSVNDNPFPFSDDRLTPEFVAECLAKGKAAVESLMAEPTPELLGRQIQSALGPMISGEGALARLAFHPAYHQGQAYLIKTAPGFPSA